MDKYLALIDGAILAKILAGTFDIDKIPASKHKDVFIMASHCCLNGPVGTNKVTTFPMITGDVSVTAFVGQRVSNNSWRSFCSTVADMILKHFPEVASSSQQFSVAGGLWPLSPSISETRNKALVAEGV